MNDVKCFYLLCSYCFISNQNFKTSLAYAKLKLITFRLILITLILHQSFIFIKFIPQIAFEQTHHAKNDIIHLCTFRNLHLLTFEISLITIYLEYLEQIRLT